MGFFYAGWVFWVLIGVSMMLFVWGLWTRYYKALLLSGILLMLPFLKIAGSVESWRGMLILVPLIPFLFAYFIRKNRLN